MTSCSKSCSSPQHWPKLSSRRSRDWMASSRLLSWKVLLLSPDQLTVLASGSMSEEVSLLTSCLVRLPSSPSSSTGFSSRASSGMLGSKNTTSSGPTTDSWLSEHSEWASEPVPCPWASAWSQSRSGSLMLTLPQSSSTHSSSTGWSSEAGAGSEGGSVSGGVTVIRVWLDGGGAWGGHVRVGEGQALAFAYTAASVLEDVVW